MSLDSKKLPLLTLIVSIFFAILGITMLPLGLHYDQMRFLVGPEQQILGLFSNFSLRETVANLLLLGYQSAVFAEFARFIGNVDLLVLIPRIVTALFFVLTSLVWLGITRELKLSLAARTVFIIVFVTSGLYIVYSKFLPMLGAYLLFVSLFWYFLIRYEAGRYHFTHLVLAGVFAIFSLYTHAMAVFVVLFTLVLWGSKFLFNSELRKQLIKKIPPIEWLVYYLFLFAVLLFPLFSTLVSTDPNISGKDEFTIFYLLKNGEYKYAAESAGLRVLTYINPQFLVAGGPMAGASLSTDIYSTANIKNPEANAFLLTNISPFGYIALLLFISFPFVILPSKNLSSRFFKLILGTYLLSALIPNFDNPSLARMLPLYMFIPLGIAILWDTIVQSRNAFVLRLGKGFVLSCVALSSGLNLFTVFSGNYAKTDAEKFDTVMMEAAKSINNTAVLQDQIIYQDSRWNGHNTLEFFFSPYILENMTRIRENNQSVDVMLASPFSTIISKQTIPDNVLKDRKVLSFSEKNSAFSQYVAYTRTNLNSCSSYPQLQANYIENTVTPLFRGNEEIMVTNFRYLPAYSQREIRLNTKAYADSLIISPTSDDLFKLTATRNLSINGISITTSGEVQKNGKTGTYLMNASKKAQELVIFLPPAAEGTYKVSFETKFAQSATFDVVMLNEKNESVPYIQQKKGKKYEYIVSAPKENSVRLVIGAYYSSYLLEAEKYPAIVEVDQLLISQLSTSVLVNANNRAREAVNFIDPRFISYSTVKNGYSIPANAVTLGNILVCPLAYSPWIEIKQDRMNLPLIRANGVAISTVSKSSSEIELKFKFPMSLMAFGLVYILLLSMYMWLIATKTVSETYTD